MDKDIKVTLKVWRQRGPKEKGQFETYPMEIHQSVSFLEMLDPPERFFPGNVGYLERTLGERR